MAHALLQATPSLRLASNAQLNRANVTRKPPATMLRISRSASTTPSRFSGLRRANSGNLPRQTLATPGATGKLSRVDPRQAMFEKLTEKAHKVVNLSLQETLGHKLAGTEQILLAIISQCAELAKAIGITLEEARLEVEKIIASGSEGFNAKMPFTAQLKRVLELAREEARQFGHDFVAQEHLLLALLRDSEGLACRVLENLGVDRINLRNEVIRMMDENAIDSTNPALVLEHIREQFLLPNEKDSLIKLVKEIGEIWKEMNAAIRVPEEARKLGDMDKELNAKLSALVDKFEQFRIPTITEDDIDDFVSAWCDILDEIMEE